MDSAATADQKRQAIGEPPSGAVRLPSRGEIWLVALSSGARNFDPVYRPALVLSVDALNHGPGAVAIVAPIAKQHDGIPTHIRLRQEDSATTVEDAGYVWCEELMSVSVERFKERRGKASPETLLDALYVLRVLLGMP